MCSLFCMGCGKELEYLSVRDASNVTMHEESDWCEGKLTGWETELRKTIKLEEM